MTVQTTRRTFLKSAAAVCAASIVSSRAYAASLHLPLGLQLYSVREMLPKDYAGTLKMIGGLGYREVEAAGFFNHSPQDVKQAMQQANLKCVSAHYSSDQLHQHFDEILAFHKEVGIGFIICSFPGYRTAPASRDQKRTIDDWIWNAEEFNKFGAKTKAAGIQFGYHNHVQEFAATDGKTPYEELLKHTDPALVAMELDCGWVVVGGGNPVAILKEHGSRIAMLHVKDFVKPASGAGGAEAYKPTELGRGFIDYRPIFEQAAKTAKIKHVFVEQEGFDVPAEESLRVDAAYVRGVMG